MLTRIIYNFLRSRPYRKTTIRYGRRLIRAEIADTFAKQMIGLMYRDSIEENYCMLFPLRFEGIITASVVMSNMRFPIDIVWLDSDGVVVDVRAKAPPARSMFSSEMYSPKAKSKYVLELRSGQASKLKIRKNRRFIIKRVG